MKDIALLQEVISDQKKELELRLTQSTCGRQEEKLVNLQSAMAQVIIGVRRSGKSTLCMNVLRQQKGKVAYCNFDDDRLTDLDAEDLNNILRSIYIVYGDFEILFLDEVQNADAWYLFVNRLLRQGKHIILTGSNSKLLSGELATHLTGRYLQVELYPFSFAEYVAYYRIDAQHATTQADALLRGTWEKYLHQGGFPELLQETRHQAYIDTLVNNIVMRDIQQRFNIRYSATFNQVVQHVLNTTPLVVNKKSLCEQFHISSIHTLENYLSYLQQAYLLIGVHKYSRKSRLRIQQEKLYAVDPALMNNRKDALSGENLGWRLETLVLIELKRRYGQNGCDIYYYAETAGEADFLVNKGDEVLEVIQVCYGLGEDKVRKRELKGLALAAMATGCRKLTLIADKRETTSVTLKDGTCVTVEIYPAYRWFLENK